MLKIKNYDNAVCIVAVTVETHASAHFAAVMTETPLKTIITIGVHKFSEPEQLFKYNVYKGSVVCQVYYIYGIRLIWLYVLLSLLLLIMLVQKEETQFFFFVSTKETVYDVVKHNIVAILLYYYYYIVACVSELRWRVTID